MAAGTRTFKAWAVDANSKENHGYLGIYAFDTYTNCQPWQDGFKVAVFRTREEAREELRKLKIKHSGYFPKSSVRRVVITVTPTTGATQ